MNTPVRQPSVRAVVLTAIVLGGCANQPDLIAAGRLTLEPRIDRALRQPPEVSEDNGDLVIAGRLERGLPRDLVGHVDVMVTAPDGAIVFDARLNYQADTVSPADIPKPLYGSFKRVSARRYGSYLAYVVRFPGLPADGSVVKVRHDAESNGARERASTTHGMPRE